MLRYMLISWSTHRTIHLFSQVWDHSNCSPLGPPAPLYLCQYQREVNTLHTGPRLLPLCTMSRATMWGIALLFKLLISFYFFKLLPQRCWNLAWDNKKIFFLHKTQQLQNEYIILDFSLYHKLFVFSPISHIC